MEKVFDSILSWEGGADQKKYLVSPRTIQDFFTQGIHLLRVPDYQRPYSWSKKNIMDLLNDVLKLSSKHNNNSSWFLGPIFTVKKSSEDQYADLLDGQQRITTLQIILREATLITKEEEGINLDDFPELKKKINIALGVCNSCLVRMNGFKSIPVFETEEQLKDIFNEYILDFSDIDDPIDLKKKRKDFEEKVLKARQEGSITAGTILESISIVRKFISKEFIKTGTDTVTNLENFFNYIDALTNKCWLIEIPLRSHDDSIQIFESLNNRGKSLTLVDKLRYKSIISCSKESINEVRNKWKKVYSGLNFLIDNGYTKNEDDFFKVFFNSINGDDFTKEEDFIELFTETYLDSDKKIVLFLEETMNIFSFFHILSKSLDAQNNFVTSYFDKKQQEKVKALLQLLKQALNISDNSRFLLFYTLRKYPNYHENNYVIIQAVWNIIRFVFHDEIFRNKNSNIVRTDYLEKIKNFGISTNTINNSSEVNSLEYNRSINYIIKTLNNDQAKFVLYMYAYLNEFDVLTSHSPKQYNKSHLDHLFPRAWKGDWNKETYTKQEVISFVKGLQIDSPELFSNISHDQFVLDIESSEDFELRDYTTIPFRQEESLIEYIGNKWVLHAGTNIKTSNNGFEFKKREYLEDKWIKIPSNNDVNGIAQFDKFSYQEILIRSLKIINSIIGKIKYDWDAV